MYREVGVGTSSKTEGFGSEFPDHEALTVQERGLQVLVTDVHMRYKVH
jgi:hypothetical protein